MSSTLRGGNGPTVSLGASEGKSPGPSRQSESKGPGVGGGEEKGPAASSVFSPDSRSEPLRLGDRIEARFREGPKWHPGKIVSVNPDGSYDIRYNDGDEERRVRRDMIRPAGGEGPKSGEQSVCLI